METGHYSVILAIIQLFSPLFSYSRQYSVILAIMFLYSVIQLFSPCVLSKVQCTYYHALAFPGKVNFRNLLEHILLSKANDSAKIKTKQKIAQLACCRCGSLRRNLK